MLGGGHIEVNLRCDHLGVHVVPSCHERESVGPCSIPGLCRGRGYHGLYVINATDPACVGFVVFALCAQLSQSQAVMLRKLSPASSSRCLFRSITCCGTSFQFGTTSSSF